jgi:hypothetical protein
MNHHRSEGPKRTGPGAKLFGAIVVLTLVAGGVAAADIPDGGSTINACYDKTSGAVRVIDASANQTCTASENPLSWSQHGLNWRGAWSKTASYAAFDAVAFSGSSYLAVNAPPVGDKPTDSAHWGVLAKQGATGPQGAAGRKVQPDRKVQPERKVWPGRRAPRERRAQPDRKVQPGLKAQADRRARSDRATTTRCTPTRPSRSPSTGRTSRPARFHLGPT